MHHHHHHQTGGRSKMPTITDKRLCKGTLTNVNATIYTVPASTTTYVKSLNICNKTAVADVVTLKFAGTEILYQHTIAAFDSLAVPFFDQILDETELIEAQAGANSSLTYYISGREVV
jgi:hypothetical protein